MYSYSLVHFTGIIGMGRFPRQASTEQGQKYNKITLTEEVERRTNIKGHILIQPNVCCVCALMCFPAYEIDLIATLRAYNTDLMQLNTHC